MTLADLFILLREELDLTQIELSQKLGISQSALSKIESGKLEPTLWTFIRASRLQPRNDDLIQPMNDFDLFYYDENL